MTTAGRGGHGVAARTGARWRDLPAEHGSWKMVAIRFSRGHQPAGNLPRSEQHALTLGRHRCGTRPALPGDDLILDPKEDGYAVGRRSTTGSASLATVPWWVRRKL